MFRFIICVLLFVVRFCCYFFFLFFCCLFVLLLVCFVLFYVRLFLLYYLLFVFCSFVCCRCFLFFYYFELITFFSLFLSLSGSLVFICLGLVTIMLCGTSVENIARILSVLAFLVMIGVSLLFYFRPDILEHAVLFIKVRKKRKKISSELFFVLLCFVFNAHLLFFCFSFLLFLFH